MSTEASLKMRIVSVLKNIGRPAHIKEISEKITDKPESSIRGRLNENVNSLFKRIARGVYWFVNEEQKSGVLLLEGNGRDISFIEDSSVDGIITDHPWAIKKSNKGGNRNFDNTYDGFLYTIEDFKEKARVLKPGCFLVEIIPAENEDNWEYLYQIKKMAKECGLQYYSKVCWKKGTFVSNTGRKSKNTEDIMIFTKGKARSLRPDKKKIKSTGEMHYMSGTTIMLPTAFELDEIDIQAIAINKKIHQSEKPIDLYQELIELISLPGEVILDTYAGSGNLGAAALKTDRFAILIEILKDNIFKIRQRLQEYTSKDHQVVYQMQMSS